LNEDQPHIDLVYKPANGTVAISMKDASDGLKNLASRENIVRLATRDGTGRVTI